MSDRGDNWNERWQEALSLPNDSDMEKRYRCGGSCLLGI